MDALFEKFYAKIEATELYFKRYLFDQINWESRLIGIKGARGAGKTTLLLQYIKGSLPYNKQKTLYVSLDDLYFTENKLSVFADAFVKEGGKFLLLDEVHRYPSWSQELKNIYDDHPSLKVVFTGSSLIHLNKAKGDLSRRAVMYELRGLSFREYLNFKFNLKIPPDELEKLLTDHVPISRKVIQQVRPLEQFREYIKTGYYPYFIESERLYHQKLFETIEVALTTDLPMVHEITHASIEKLRLLLHILAEGVPFIPNISKISERMGVTRTTLLHFLYYLEELRVIKKLYSSVRGISILQKPGKIYLYHPNLFFALANENSDKGNLRESFFLNQVGAYYPVTYAPEGDFASGKNVFEVGGKNKNNKQIRNLSEKGFIVPDDIESGYKNKIPLWVFGLLY